MTSPTLTREELLVTLSAMVMVLPDDRPQLVAIDGMSCVGKSMLATELSPVLEAAGRSVVRISYDDFHQPRAVRHRRERLSPEGYLDDSYDPDALRALVLEPLARSENHVRAASYDLAEERPAAADPVAVQPGAVVLVEGEFLLGPQLGVDWDLGILLVGEPGAVLDRALVRDADLGTPEQVREVYLRRYLGAWSLYEERHDPWTRADVVVDLTDPLAPRLLSGG
jgi:uridine kinase